MIVSTIFRSIKITKKTIDTVDKYAFYAVVGTVLVVGLAGAALLTAIDKATQAKP